MWDLWWIKWNWGEVSLRVLRVSAPVLIPSIIYVPLPTAIWTRNLYETAFSRDGFASYKE
jgi:hypothetical protein